ncbi:MAG: ATP-dependent sacrificial sulfur transferase LarE [Kiritimatiellales bacterium]|nr:ATP-dependent sacrificial sulfur transferase LarE [Kiritimatiellota bacterium]MBL7012048.1 ATP-dependent sacrificial sulfur transferase LarE [Kiritimatiellales bacterium]
MKLEEKLQALNEVFEKLEKCAVAFSGGVDSTFLLAAAVRALGAENVIAATAVSATLTDAEKVEAQELGKTIGVEHALLETTEFDDPTFTANDPLRCYYCKKNRFQSLANWAVARGFPWVVEGSNVDDSGDYRPGQKAVAELDAVRSPLKEAGLTKAEIRAVSKQWNLSTANKLSDACLATRLEYGLELTPERLKRVEAAEQFIRPLIQGHLRVRHHGALARIEVEPEYIAKLAEPETAATIVARLKELGFDHVALDLSGYKMGSMNKGIGGVE